ncbi:hypothetical protein [Corynebacterium sp. 13CS0277]|uniref:hypothetical protein n=1 Tax=Corynebacterium sp. 13CS0277 TaxID=2071994 RepID=UPI001304EB59|nr:hypothetical protein [Corynebacterium sp. 13CS0277]
MNATGALKLSIPAWLSLIPLTYSMFQDDNTMTALCYVATFGCLTHMFATVIAANRRDT